jgi:hypothetical protein
MNFYKINKGGACNNKGVTVQIKHPEYLEYRDNSRSVDVSIGYDPIARKIYVYASDLTNWNEPPSLVINDIDRKEIIKNLEEALSLLKGNYVVS